MTAMTLAQAEADLSVLIQLDIPTILVGPVGVGKTDVVRKVARQLNALVIDKRASQMAETDLTLPMPDNATGTIKNYVPSWLPDAALASQHPLIILLLDELSDAQVPVQAALNQLILERELPGYKLPANVRIVATGNRASDRAAAQKFSRATANRLAIIEIMVDVAAWLAWAIANGIADELIAYITLANQQSADLGLKALHAYPASGSDAQAFTTPRSLARCSPYFNPALGIKDNQLRRLIAHNCGDDTADSIMNFLATYRLVPDLAAIIADPANAKVHREPSVNYLLTVGLVSRLTHANLSAIVTYVKRLSSAYQAAFWSNAIAKDETFSDCRERVEYLISTSNA